jgi:hypothetical protein
MTGGMRSTQLVGKTPAFSKKLKENLRKKNTMEVTLPV